MAKQRLSSATIYTSFAQLFWGSNTALGPDHIVYCDGNFVRRDPERLKQAMRKAHPVLHVYLGTFGDLEPAPQVTLIADLDAYGPEEGQPVSNWGELGICLGTFTDHDAAWDLALSHIQMARS